MLVGRGGDRSGRDGRRDSDDSAADSDFDSWTDTGDIAEQLADEEDPLRIRLQDTTLKTDDGFFAGLRGATRHHDSSSSSHGKKKQNKRVQFRRSVSSHSDPLSKEQSGVVNKEAIEVPDVAPRRPSRGVRLLAAIMPGTGIHGLTGKPLMCVDRSSPRP